MHTTGFLDTHFILIRYVAIENLKHYFIKNHATTYWN